MRFDYNSLFYHASFFFIGCRFIFILVQGVLLLWVDIYSRVDALKIPPIPIVSPEKKTYEVIHVLAGCWMCDL